MEQTLVTRIVEAALLAAHQPLSLVQLHALFPDDAPAPADSVEQALETLREACADRGVELVELASGFRYQVQADVHPWVARLWTERQTRYTRATLETLALIAYRQPVTRGEIEQVRGVAVNSNIIKALEEREWIRVVGHRDVPGKPALFGTTKTFLDYFGLKRLDELPPLSELKELGELEPQFQFEGAVAQMQPIAAGGIEQGLGAEGADNDDGSAADVGTRQEPSTGDDAGTAGAPSILASAEFVDAGHDPEAAPVDRAADESVSDMTSQRTTETATHATAPTTDVADEQTFSNETDDTETASSEQQK
ncbi:MAG TPA: SMC-Scp complex subunit ScpB [Lysobacter sp.]|nr:SMC-Scp complex subunit ScpB [Lysobacter sp.]